METLFNPTNQELEPLEGKNVLITGGTGSFGSQFINTLLDNSKIRRLVIFSRDELKQFEMQERLKNHPKFSILRFFIGDVRDYSRLKVAFRNMDIVIHAAALKQVPMAEYNPFECIRTNVMGAENIVHAALDTDVKKVVALSTDKATNPVNLYGASKLASDKIFVAANNISGSNGCSFSVVRYGNVVGSRGSVIPFFKKLINDGATELPITHPEMTRFWITLQSGVNFVISTLEKMQGGEIFIPKIPSMRIMDLANTIGPDLEKKVIGIRPGEKLHEMMIPRDLSSETVELPDRYIIQPSFAFWEFKKDFYDNAKPVHENFEYTSDKNDQWLTDQELLELI